MAKIAKRMQKINEGVDRDKYYPLGEAVSMIKERAVAKFDETIEVSMNLGVDPRHADQMVRGVVNLPNGTGRTVRVAVFARGDKADEARAAGADIVGAEELVDIVQAGTIDFDRCIATPDMMPLVGRLGVEKAGIVHAGIGKASFGPEQIEENIRAFADAVIKAKPVGAKGNYLKRMAISSTMGPGVKIDPSSLSAA